VEVMQKTMLEFKSTLTSSLVTGKGSISGITSCHLMVLQITKKRESLVANFTGVLWFDRWIMNSFDVSPHRPPQNARIVTVYFLATEAPPFIGI